MFATSILQYARIEMFNIIKALIEKIVWETIEHGIKESKIKV